MHSTYADGRTNAGSSQSRRWIEDSPLSVSSTRAGSEPSAIASEGGVRTEAAANAIASSSFAPERGRFVGSLLKQSRTRSSTAFESTCGARPLAFTLALALPRVDQTFLDGFSQGLFALADAHGCELVGGDTTQGPLNICITVFGELPAGAALLRSGAQAGDDVYVSGCVGDAHAGSRGRSLCGA